MAFTYIVSESLKAQEVASIAQQILNKIKTPDGVEVVVAIGGDGTLLHAIKKHFQNPAAALCRHICGQPWAPTGRGG